MMINKVVICPICGKKTFLRIQDGGYLPEYPIRVNCINCRALIKGAYTMNLYSKLNMLNADIEEPDLDATLLTVKNADYVAEISGELPCRNVRVYEGGLPESPFLRAADNLESMQDRITRLTYFTNNMEEWKRKKSTAFQLLDDGSIEYISIALSNKMGEYSYACDNYLKSIHCLQEVVLEETKYLFINPIQDDYVSGIIEEMSKLDKEKVHQLADKMGGVQGLILAYRKTIEVFSGFMNIYPNLLPAETYMRFRNQDNDNACIATCSFSDVKSYYQDAYESLLSLLYVPVCLDNIKLRGNFQKFSRMYDDVFCPEKKCRDFRWYRGVDNGTRVNKLCVDEPYQKMLELPANRLLRNGIGHNNIKYDSISQIITAYDMKKPEKINYQKNLMSVAIDCIGLAKSAVILSEMILFILRQESRVEGVSSIIHPRFYSGAQSNDKCPCGSGLKYKKCCKNDVENVSRSRVK